MGNRVYLYNKSSKESNEYIQISETQNRIPLLWCLLFNIEDLVIRVHPGPEYQEIYDYVEGGENFLIEFICSTSKAIKNLKSKATIAKEAGIQVVIINKLEEVIKSLKYDTVIAEITSYSEFYSTHEEMKEELLEFLNLTKVETQFPSQTCAIDLAGIYEELNLPIPKSIKALWPQIPKIKVKKERLLGFLDEKGKLTKDYFIKYGFNSDFFNLDNDHNPLVLHPCTKCKGNGSTCWYDPPLGAVTCDICCGSGYEEILRPMFDNDTVTYQRLTNNAFTYCPFCNENFSINDKHHWTGLRHGCGQKIILKKSLMDILARLHFLKRILRSFFTFK